MSLILGTANFSKNYGTFSLKNKDENELKTLIEFAQKNGLNHFDSAREYKGAEKILGKYLNKSIPVDIDTKISLQDCTTTSTIISSIKESLDNIGIDKFTTVYLHDQSLIVNDNSNIVKSGLDMALELGLTSYIGVSVYTKEDLINCKKIFSKFTRFQIIENVCDRRLIESPELIAISESGSQIDVRSIFLQGLLLAEPQKIPDYLSTSKYCIEKFIHYSETYKISRLDLCMSYAKLIKWAKNIVIGADSTIQLQDIINSQYDLPLNWNIEIPTLPKYLMDPRNWQK
jgi:aryl-alcohol dehydrogenase-like predicted oxidoreductase